MTSRHHRALAAQLRRRWGLILVIFVVTWAVVSVVQALVR